MNPADLTLSISPTLTSKQIPAPLLVAQKNGKVPVPRVDLEPIYTQLKSALGDQWGDYKAAVNSFVCGMCAEHMQFAGSSIYREVKANGANY